MMRTPHTAEVNAQESRGVNRPLFKMPSDEAIRRMTNMNYAACLNSKILQFVQVEIGFMGTPTLISSDDFPHYVGRLDELMQEVSERFLSEPSMTDALPNYLCTAKKLEKLYSDFQHQLNQSFGLAKICWKTQSGIRWMTNRATLEIARSNLSTISRYNEMRKKAEEYANGDLRLFNYIDKILSDRKFQSNPQNYLHAWKERRGYTHEFRMPEDQARLFFDQFDFVKNQDCKISSCSFPIA